MGLKLVLICITVCIQVVPSTRYYVRVKTGYFKAAGTNDAVFITLFGTNGQSAKTQIVDHDRYVDIFQPGKTDHFTITTPSNLGTLIKLVVEINNSTSSSDWFLNYIAIWDHAKFWPKYYFDYYKWIRSSKKLLPLTIGPALKVDKPTEDYVVEVSTGNKEWANTDAHVFISLGGKKGKTHKIELQDSNKDTFEMGKTDTFNLKLLDLGQIQWISVEHDDTGGSHSGWNLIEIIVYNKAPHSLKYKFTCDCWLMDPKLATVLIAVPTTPKAGNVNDDSNSGSSPSGSGSGSGSGNSTALKAGFGVGGVSVSGIILFILYKKRDSVKTWIMKTYICSNCSCCKNSFCSNLMKSKRDQENQESSEPQNTTEDS